VVTDADDNDNDADNAGRHSTNTRAIYDISPIMTHNISSTMRDSDLVSTDHQQERTMCGSNGHVTDDVT